ncbi:hypothetical protein [Lacrimispora sp. 210928-DFI.3.58]|uniref:hypothetical protein n=1 Tax=Lacrimispora sp. 210928-DFI.3.58 TaxID=2883214 RepID=UPI001D0873E8|nr:hypothetical protein [Lacrimispora sp. 210928-DFI.3.58]MCB7319908.1 hypothetical protein [Lacrimispora sp. 210928-DFI.3.58]
MLRLAGFKSDAVQEVITEQMIWGFREMFGINSGGKPEEEKVKDFLRGALHINTDDGISELSLQGITGRLENMYKNLTDREQEYTFDEFGEFLMDECLLYFGERINESDWKECGTPEQRQDIYEMCLAYADDADPEEDDGYDAAKEAEDLCRAIFYLPELAYGKGHEDVLFWDGDFLWYCGWNAMTGALRMHGYVRCAQLTESM